MFAAALGATITLPSSEHAPAARSGILPGETPAAPATRGEAVGVGETVVSFAAGSGAPVAEPPPVATTTVAHLPDPRSLVTKPAARSTPSATGRPTRRSNASCTPNYSFDSEGNKHFKPECF
jgi:hypothetical protein